MWGPEYLLKCPELLVTAKDQLEGHTDFLETSWHQWEMTPRESASNSATQATHICRHCLLNTGHGMRLKRGIVILTVLGMRKGFRERKWLVEATGLESYRSGIQFQGQRLPEHQPFTFLVLNYCFQQDAEPGSVQTCRFGICILTQSTDDTRAPKT